MDGAIGPARGLLEGYYGPPWSAAERHQMLRAAARMGYTGYLIGLKDDPFHRDRWREPYPPYQLGHHASLVRAGQSLGVEVGFALSPGLDMAYGTGAELERLLAKYRPWQAMGSRLFGLFFDDIPPGAEPLAFADAQAEVARHLGRALGADAGRCILLFCPTDYWGTQPSPYLERLGRTLPPWVKVFWTGPEIVSPTIAAADAAPVAQALGRRPALWDNYPVNDAGMTLELHLGPLRGRSPDLPDALDGYWLNVMEYAHPSLIPLDTAAQFLSDPHRYVPEEALAKALARWVPEGELAQALGVLVRLAGRSAVAGRGPGPSPEDAAQALAAAHRLLAAEHPVADALRPWAHKLALVAQAQVATAGERAALAAEAALFPHEVNAAL
jgi:hyaluronoglucosaminidase